VSGAARDDRPNAIDDPELLLAIIDGTETAVSVKDLEGCYVFVNRLQAELSGLPGEEMLGRTDAELFAAEVAEELRRCDLEALERGTVRSETSLLALGGGELQTFATTTFPLLDSNGAMVGICAIGVDVTALKALQIENEHMEAELRQARKLEAVGRLVGGVAHDFNNVLTAIRGYSEFLVEGLPESSPLRADAEELRKVADRTGGLTRQLLAFSRRDAPQLENLDLNELVSDVDKMLHRLIGPHVELVTMLDPMLHRVEADRGRLEQVIVNLALNARDAMPAGGKLLIETANASVGEPPAGEQQELEPGDYVTVAFRDTGVGMGDETTSRIFDPFFTTKVEEGTGLGLATVSAIVEQSGGRIFVYSEPGWGTTFKIYLRAAAVESSTVPIAIAEPGSRDGLETVLLVEDDEALRTLALRTLDRKGYRVYVAENAREALELWEERQAEIDALVTDVVMPGMSGIELAERLAAARPSIRIVLMSGLASPAAARQIRSDPPVVFLDKPFAPDSLVQALRDTSGQ
jgi:PAS domain S-box-containing protein